MEDKSIPNSASDESGIYSCQNLSSQEDSSSSVSAQSTPAERNNRPRPFSFDDTGLDIGDDLDSFISPSRNDDMVVYMDRRLRQFRQETRSQMEAFKMEVVTTLRNEMAKARDQLPVHISEQQMGQVKEAVGFHLKGMMDGFQRDVEGKLNKMDEKLDTLATKFELHRSDTTNSFDGVGKQIQGQAEAHSELARGGAARITTVEDRMDEIGRDFNHAKDRGKATRLQCTDRYNTTNQTLIQHEDTANRTTRQVYQACNIAVMAGNEINKIKIDMTMKEQEHRENHQFSLRIHQRFQEVIDHAGAANDATAAAEPDEEDGHEPAELQDVAPLEPPDSQMEEEADMIDLQENVINGQPDHEEMDEEDLSGGAEGSSGEEVHNAGHGRQANLY